MPNSLQLALHRILCIQRFSPVHRLQSLLFYPVKQICASRNIMDQSDDLSRCPDLYILVRYPRKEERGHGI